MEDILITFEPIETINIAIERLEIINIGEDHGNMPDFLTIYQQAKEL